MTNQQGAPEALRLADEYAAAHAKWALEDLYGTSKSYTAEMLAERHAARERLAAALVEAQQPAPSAAAVEHGDGFMEAINEMDELRPFQAAPQPSTTPQADSQPALVATNYKQALWSKNCMQCCVSYMLGLPLNSAPDFATDGGWELFIEFVDSKGYAAVMLLGNHEFEADYLASGTTARGTSHMVVMNDGKLVHDPHPSNAGLTEVQCVWLLAKKATPQRDDREAFEACAKAYTSNVSFERDVDDYEDMTASLLWHGWKLRAARATADSVTAPAATPAAAAIAWNALRDATDPLGETGTRIMGLVRVFAQRQYEAGLAEGRATPPAQAADSVLEDAARLDWLALAGPTSICLVIDRPYDGEIEVATDDVTGYGKTLREALDAARKQGGA